MSVVVTFVLTHAVHGSDPPQDRMEGKKKKTEVLLPKVVQIPLKFYISQYLYINSLVHTPALCFILTNFIFLCYKYSSATKKTTPLTGFIDFSGILQVAGSLKIPYQFTEICYLHSCLSLVKTKIVQKRVFSSETHH